MNKKPRLEKDSKTLGGKAPSIRIITPTSMMSVHPSNGYGRHWRGQMSSPMRPFSALVFNHFKQVRSKSYQCMSSTMHHRLLEESMLLKLLRQPMDEEQ